MQVYNIMLKLGDIGSTTLASDRRLDNQSIDFMVRFMEHIMRGSEHYVNDRSRM